MGAPDLGLRARARLGTTLRGKYRLERVLGVGGMAVVYQAKHRNQAEFAVKMLLPELSHEEEIRARFLREGYAANSVKHPGVVAIVDDDVAEDGAAFLVMELLAGMSVEDIAERRGGRVPARITTAIGVQLLDVLAAAHAKNVLHRDVKPSNLFVTNAGVVKLLDFGIARVRDVASSGAYATRSSVSFGPPAFMATEQARGKTREVDERSDVWAVGATLFTILSGRLVHEGENGAEIVVKAATQPAPRLRAVAPAIPPSVASAIDRALAFDPKQRWASAVEMRDALAAAHVASFGGAPSFAELAAFLAETPPSPSPVPDDDTTRKVGGANAAAGATTGMPVASDAVRAARRRRGVAVAVTSALAAAALGVAGLAALARMRQPAASVARPPPSESAASIAPSSLPSAEPPPPEIDVTALPTVAPSPSSSARAAAPARPRSSAPRVKGDCNPRYVLDAEGNKHFKPECF